MGNIYEQLSLEERTMIHTHLERGIKPAAIATGLNRPASTLARELKRNGWIRPKTRGGPGRPPMAGGYRAEGAHTRARAGPRTPRGVRRLRPGSALWAQVIHYLNAGDSPEQMAGILARMHPHMPAVHVSHATIYTAIYAMPRGALRTDVIGWVRVGHATRRPRARGDARRGRIPGMVSIHDRPPELEARLVPGHWEGDLIKGAQHRSAIGTLVERTPVFTVLARMDQARAEAALSGFSHVLNRLEAPRRLSLTYDPGRERAAHQQLTDATGVNGYVADPHSPWPRGINEHTHGLLRPYWPKGSDLSLDSHAARDAMAWTLNTRPRTSRGFQCPAELLTPEAFDFRQYHAALFALGH